MFLVVPQIYSASDLKRKERPKAEKFWGLSNLATYYRLNADTKCMNVLSRPFKVVQSLKMRLQKLS